MIQCTVKGDFKNSLGILNRILKTDYMSILEKYAEQGVEALAAATPVRTGKTAASWDYSITRESGSIVITWTNSNVVNGIPIAVILDMGHGTRGGGYVQGRNFISPAIQPVFDEIADKAWKEVTRN